MKMETQIEIGIATAGAEPNRTCVEYLQREIVHLLMRNQTIRFELLAAYRRIDCIEEILFGGEARNLEPPISPTAALILRELCRSPSSCSDPQSSSNHARDAAGPPIGKPAL
jgi:hypothetical protein